MTNEQLQMLLLNLVARLEDAINEADENLGDVPRHKGQRYIGNARMPGLAALSKKNPEDWEETEKSAIALDGVVNVVADIKEQAIGLSGTLLMAESDA